MAARIVVVEDDPSVAELVTMYLRNAEFIVTHARTAAEARVKFDEEKPALVGEVVYLAAGGGDA